jgi:hypothetical protein
MEFDSVNFETNPISFTLGKLACPRALSWLMVVMIDCKLLFVPAGALAEGFQISLQDV